jgi:hypothetical protein
MLMKLSSRMLPGPLPSFQTLPWPNAADLSTPWRVLLGDTDDDRLGTLRNLCFCGGQSPLVRVICAADMAGCAVAGFYGQNDFHPNILVGARGRSGQASRASISAALSSMADSVPVARARSSTVLKWGAPGRPPRSSRSRHRCAVPSRSSSCKCAHRGSRAPRTLPTQSAPMSGPPGPDRRK